MVKVLFATAAITMLLASAAQAQSWYLMAPDEKIVSEPSVATRMERGPVMGPLEFISREKFSSRAECEPARDQLVTKWRQLSVIKRGSWNRYGFTSPSIFVRCVPANDPQLKKRGPESRPLMETFINRPRHR